MPVQIYPTIAALIVPGSEWIAPARYAADGNPVPIIDSTTDALYNAAVLVGPGGRHLEGNSYISGNTTWYEWQLYDAGDVQLATGRILPPDPLPGRGYPFKFEAGSFGWVRQGDDVRGVFTAHEAISDPERHNV